MSSERLAYVQLTSCVQGLVHWINMKVLSNTLVAAKAASFYFFPRQLFMSVLKNNRPKYRESFAEKKFVMDLVFGTISE